MTTQQITTYLQGLETKLCSKTNRQLIILTREWAKLFPTNAGVYLIRENGVISYVGETGSIRERMKDLLNTQNHVIRRSIGNKKYKDHKGFEKATSHKQFIPEIEAKLNKWIEGKLEISTLVVDLGRKEFEEYLYDKHKPKYNNKGKRTSKE
jgi:excinuclease UvrABC nuclease subunit